MRLCAASRPGQQLARQQQAFAGLPAGDFFLGQAVERHAARAGIGATTEPSATDPDPAACRTAGPVAIQREMNMAGGGAVGNHRHRQGCSMGGVIQNLDIEHGGQAAETLRADAERVDAPVDLQAQLFQLGFRSARDEIADVDGLHQRFLREQHGLLGAAADARRPAFPADTSPRPFRAPSPTPNRPRNPMGSAWRTWICFPIRRPSRRR